LENKTRGKKSLEGVTFNVKGEEKEQNKKRKIRNMKIGGAHEDREILFKEIILSRGVSLAIDVKGGEKHEERKIKRNVTRGV
jgi:hypothetical protein